MVGSPDLTEVEVDSPSFDQKFRLFDFEEFELAFIGTEVTFRADQGLPVLTCIAIETGVTLPCGFAPILSRFTLFPAEFPRVGIVFSQGWGEEFMVLLTLGASDLGLAF